MKKLLIGVIFLSNLQAQSKYCPITYKQISTLYKARHYGSRVKIKETNESLKYTFIALTGKESAYGRDRANYVSGCFGVGNIRLGTYMDYHHIPKTQNNMSKYTRLLQSNDHINFQAMEENLKGWIKYHRYRYRGRWRIPWKRVYASYYAGTDWKKGIEYANDIICRIKWAKSKGY